MNTKERYSIGLKQRFLFRSVALLLVIFCGSVFVELGQAAESLAAHQIRCSPKSFTRDEFLNIEMGIPHSGKLSITRPDGKVFFIAHRVLGSVIIKAIPSELFRSVVTLKISPKTFVAHRWEVNAPNYELVFNKIGTYKMILGEAME